MSNDDSNSDWLTVSDSGSDCEVSPSPTTISTATTTDFGKVRDGVEPYLPKKALDVRSYGILNTGGAAFLLNAM